jgi:hypothetical protein
VTTTNQTLNRATAALAGALATDDPEVSKHFVAIIAECFAQQSELLLPEFERQVTNGLHPVLDRSAAAIAERTTGMSNVEQVEAIIRDEMLGSLARAGRQVLT